MRGAIPRRASTLRQKLRLIIGQKLVNCTMYKMDILETRVLKLDRNWRPFATCSVRKAFLDAGAGAVTLLRFHEGNPTPYRLDDWLNIPVEDKEEFVSTGGKFHGEIRKIAVPRVVICVGFDQVILEKQRYKRKPINLKNVAELHEETCAVSNKKLKPEEFSIEHVRPRSKGGKNEWGNVVLMDRKLNSKRGNKSYRKIGLKKPKIKKAPLREAAKITNDCGYPEWALFGIK